MDFSLLGAAALGLVAAYGVLRLEPRPEPEDGPTRSWDVLLTAAVAGLISGRLAAMVSTGTNPITHPLDGLIVRGGVDTGFAAAAALVTAAILTRRDLAGRLDALAPAAIAGLSGWHAGCLVRGTCLGTPTGLPWGVAQSGGTIPRHPVEIYAAVLLALGVVLVIVWRRRGAPPGSAAGAALAWAAGIRLATEPMRPGIGAGPEWWYAAGVAIGAGVVAWSWWRSRRSQP